MTQKKSSKDDAPKSEDIEVAIEGEEEITEASPPGETIEPAKEPEAEEDVTALRKQLEDLERAQEGYRNREKEAQQAVQQAAQQLHSFRQSAEQSQYDALVTAMGAAEMEVASAKQDIVLAGNAQDYSLLADAQERLSAAKTRMVSLEMGKDNYERAMQQHAQPQQQVDPVTAFIQHNPNITYEEKLWIREHPDAITDSRKNAKLNAAYFDALDDGIQRGTRDYFKFIEEKLGYREPGPVSQAEESSVMVAAPPSKSVPSGSGAGGSKTSFSMTKEEAEVAKASGITPAEYVKQREHLKELKKQGHYTNQG